MANPALYYSIPAEIYRTGITVINSRFITTIAPAPSVESARAFLAGIRTEMPDASHHVHAFRVGHGNSVIEGMSDDGEPSGTAGPPTLAVLRGSDVGDIVLVTTRYFGGTKLGTGGLVRAYGDAARTALSNLPTTKKIPKTLLGIETPYHFYELVKRLIVQHQGTIDDETFMSDVTVLAIFPNDAISAFTEALKEATAGRLEPIALSNLDS